jgi:hypothetical protein
MLAARVWGFVTTTPIDDPADAPSSNGSPCLPVVHEPRQLAVVEAGQWPGTLPRGTGERAREGSGAANGTRSLSASVGCAPPAQGRQWCREVHPEWLQRGCRWGCLRCFRRQFTQKEARRPVSRTLLLPRSRGELGGGVDAGWFGQRCPPDWLCGGTGCGVAAGVSRCFRHLLERSWPPKWGHLLQGLL